jgi:ETFB lysine methyltransferase
VISPLNLPREVLDVSIAGRQWTIERAADLESLWEAMGQDDFGRDERIPYWAELWPASTILGEWIMAHGDDIRGRHCLDLGCGLGLTACIAAAAGGLVTAMDYEWPAMHFTRRNMARNRVSFLPIQMDWRKPALQTGRFSFVFGGDVLYEKRFVPPLIRLFQSILAPDGRVWLAEADRQCSKTTWPMFEEAGFSVQELCRVRVPWKKQDAEVVLREISRKEKNHG